MESDPPKSNCRRSCQVATEPKDYVLNLNPSRPVTIRPKISISDLVQELNNLPEENFGSEEVADFLQRHPIDQDSLSKFTHFRTGAYTRNLVYANDRFEIMLLCWDRGCCTPIHNHEQQNCWVYVQSGYLSFSTFKWHGCDRKNRTVQLEKLSHIPMAASGTLNVIDEKDAIHCLANDESFDSQASSLHVYAKPIKTCAVYNVETGKCEDRVLKYDSTYGKLVSGF